MTRATRTAKRIWQQPLEFAIDRRQEELAFVALKPSRAAPTAGQANGAADPSRSLRNLQKFDRMLPIIVVPTIVRQSIAGSAKKLLKPYVATGLNLLEVSPGRIRIDGLLPADEKVLQRIRRTHGDLDHDMQSGKLDTRRNQDSTPDSRTNMIDCDIECVTDRSAHRK